MDVQSKSCPYPVPVSAYVANNPWDQSKQIHIIQTELGHYSTIVATGVWGQRKGYNSRI